MWASETQPHVLFICEAGIVKSAIAREYLRRRATARGISLIASSRGIAPADHVSPSLRAALAADRIDSASEPLRQLAAGDIATADIVVFFNRPKTLALPADARDWSSVGSMNDDFGAARADLVQRIDALLDTIMARRR